MPTSNYPLHSLALRAIPLAFVWWILSRGELTSWIIGLPVTLIAAHISLRLSPPQEHRVHFIPLLKFIPFFLYESIRGGIDVARRTYNPSRSLQPILLTYPLRLPNGSAQIFFANSVSLLPGTLGAGIQNNHLLIHILDETAPITRELICLESKVAAIFKLDLVSQQP